MAHVPRNPEQEGRASRSFQTRRTKTRFPRTALGNFLNPSLGSGDVRIRARSTPEAWTRSRPSPCHVPMRQRRRRAGGRPALGNGDQIRGNSARTITSIQVRRASGEKAPQMDTRWSPITAPRSWERAGEEGPVACWFEPLRNEPSGLLQGVSRTTALVEA
jgi:hypothetical protein